MIRRAEEIYRRDYKLEDGLAATFHVIWFIGWQEAASGQPQPKPRGSAEKSFQSL